LQPACSNHLARLLASFVQRLNSTRKCDSKIMTTVDDAAMMSK